MSGRPRLRTLAALGTLVLVAVAAVVAGDRLRTAPAAESEPAAPETVQSEALPLSLQPTVEDTERSVATLRRLDDHPLYEMTYWGPAATVAEPESTDLRQRPQRRAYACTLFTAVGDPAHPLFGRNFDWDANPALVLHANPRGAYRSVSVVDLSYLGFTDAAAIEDPARRGELMRAVTLPFDGMNEHGLTIGMAAVDDATPELRPGRPAVGSVGVMRMVLDTARTVDEAVKVLGSFNIDFNGGPGLHYLVADPSGASAAVEFVDGRLRVVPRAATDAWQVMENFHLSAVTGPQRDVHPRYTAADGLLRQSFGRPGEAAALDLLTSVAQGHTQWSAVYDLGQLSLALYTDKRRDRVHHIPWPG